MRWIFLLPLIFIAVVLVSGCTGNRMEIGNGGQLGDTERAMPPPEPEPQTGGGGMDAVNQTTPLTETEEVAKTIETVIVSIMPIFFITTLIMIVLGGSGRRRWRRGW